MRLISKILVAAALITPFVLGGPEYVAIVVLAALAPVFAWLLASVFALTFLALAAVIAPIGHYVARRAELKANARPNVRTKEMEWRRAA